MEMFLQVHPHGLGQQAAQVIGRSGITPLTMVAREQEPLEYMMTKEMLLGLLVYQ